MDIHRETDLSDTIGHRRAGHFVAPDEMGLETISGYAKKIMKFT